MQLLSILTFVAFTVAGVSAIPNGKPPKPAPPPPPPPPPKTVQQVSCSSGSPYCCTSGDTSIAGTTCVSVLSQNAICNAVIVCCNNNNGFQSCSGNLAQPITIL